MPPAGANNAGSPTTGVGGRTRSTAVNQGPMTKVQLMASGQAEVTSLHKARCYLTSKGYTTEERPPNPHDFAAILFALSQEANAKRMAEGVRAVAWVLENELSKTMGKAVGDAAANVIVPATHSLSGQVSALEKLLGKLCGVTERMEKCGRDMHGERSTGGTTGGMLHGPGHAHPSYAEALKAQLPVTHETTVMREKIKARQIIVDVEGDEATEMRALSEVELVAKANLTLEYMADKMGMKSPDGAKFIGMRKMRNGGFLYEVDSAETAQWLRQTDHSLAFSSAFGHTSIMRERAFPVIVEFVPTSLAPEKFGAIGRVEEANPNLEGAIAKMKWIKPLERRKEGQKTAHLMMTVRSEKQANEVICAGVILEGRRVWARRIFKDVTRCLKCQRFANHFAADCPETEDICGNCAQKHKTKECTHNGKPENYACANCEIVGHAAWSRDCPIFVRRNDSLKDKYPETKYRYYLTDDPATWELESGRQPSFANQQGQQPQSQGPQRPAPANHAVGDKDGANKRGRRRTDTQVSGRQSQLSTYGFTNKLAQEGGSGSQQHADEPDDDYE